MLTISGHSRDSQTQFSIASTILEVEGLLGSLKPANVVLELNLVCEGVYVLGERGGFVSSLLNIVKNASEAFDGAHGQITISTFRSIECPERAFIKICDTGPGVRHTNIEFQTHDLFTTKRNGTGLGLASVREFCYRCAWTIELVSESGSGTSILLSAPIADFVKRVLG
jgi:signal transduction histidine kinase